MAFRKQAIMDQFAAAQTGSLEPGERVLAGSLTISGPSPWLTGAIGIIFMLLLGMRYYFLVVTDRRVLFLKASMLTGRPNGAAWADPRSSATITDVKAAKLWSHFSYLRPGEKPLRLNFHRIWRDEMLAIVQVLSVPVAPAHGEWPLPATPPTPPPPPAAR